MKPAILIIMLSTLASVIHCREARGAVILDQSTPTTGFNVEIGYGASSPSQYLAGETFTVGIAGILDSITLFVDYNETAGTDLLQIRSTTGSGAPSTSVLGGENFAIPESIGGSTINIDISSLNIRVTVGEKLFFDIGGAPESLSFDGFDPPVYSGGAFYQEFGTNGFTKQSIQTLGFQTYVEIPSVPEPPSLTLVFASCVMLLTWRLLSNKSRMPA
jgi:hypothetical protein